MTTAAERLTELRKKLTEAREDNLLAVEDEKKRQQTQLADGYESSSDEDTTKEKIEKRKHEQDSKGIKRARLASTQRNVKVFEADDEESDERLRSMKRREKNVPLKNDQTQENADNQIASGVVVYGGNASTTKNQDCAEMVEELQQVEQRRFKYHRRRKFREGGTDINFINEGNRLFNRVLDRHFDKHESVRKLKNDLERGTG